MKDRYTSDAAKFGKQGQYDQGPLRDAGVSWRLDVLDSRFALEAIARKIGLEGQGQYWTIFQIIRRIVMSLRAYVLFAVSGCSCTQVAQPGPVPVPMKPTVNSARHDQMSTKSGGSSSNSHSDSKYGAGDVLPMATNVNMPSGKPVFTVTGFECEGTDPVQVDSIAVGDPAHHDFKDKPICMLRAVGGTSGKCFPQAGWEYGAPMDGYRLQGTCPPLGIGKTYEVSTIGTGVGYAVFSINKDGTVRIIDEECQSIREKRQKVQQS